MKLSFYDHHRQHYAANLPIKEFGEFMLGEYNKHGGVGEGGEFKILIHDHRRVSGGGLAPQLCVFGDGHGSLMEFIRLGGLTVFEEDVRDRDEFTERLVGLGLVDMSDSPVEEAS